MPTNFRFEFQPWETRTAPQHPFADAFTRVYWRGQERLVWLKAHDGFLWCRADGEDEEWNFVVLDKGATRAVLRKPEFLAVESPYFPHAYEWGRLWMPPNSDISLGINVWGQFLLLEPQRTKTQVRIQPEEGGILSWSSSELNRDLESQWANPNSLLKFEADYHLTNRDRQALAYTRFSRGSCEEMLELWRWLIILSDETRVVAHEVKASQISLVCRIAWDGEPPFIQPEGRDEENRSVPLSPGLPWLAELWQNYFAPVADEAIIARHPFLNRGKHELYPYLFFPASTAEPTSHQKLEAHLQLRAWLHGKVADDEIERLLQT